MLYPQNGDRIVTIDSVTSLHPVPHRRRRSNQERDTTRQRVVSAAGGLRCQEGSTECTVLGGFDIVQLGPTDDHTPRCALQPGIRCARLQPDIFHRTTTADRPSVCHAPSATTCWLVCNSNGHVRPLQCPVHTVRQT